MTDHQSADRFASLFATMPVGVVYQDADGHITHANPAAQRMLGLTLHQMQGRTSVDPHWRATREDGSDFPGDEHPSMVALRTGAPVRDVVMGVYNPLLDEQRWIAIDATPLFRDPDDATAHEVYTTFLDITDRRLAQQALEHSEVRFATLFDAMLEGFAYCRMLYADDGRPEDFVYLAVNPAFARLTGLQDVVGRRVTEVIPGVREQAPELFDAYGRVARQGGAADFEIEFTPLDMWLHIRVYQPEPDHFVAVFEDVTERRRDRDALQAAHRLLHEVQSLSRLGGWEYDVGERHIAWTSEVYRIYGVPASYDPNDVDAHIGFYAPDDRAIIAEAFRRAVEEGEPYDLELRLTRADGETIWVRTVGRPVREDGRVVRVTGNIMDVTERRRARDEICRLNTELQRRVDSRTAQLDEVNRELEAFAYSIAHDLRAPLRAIDGFSEIVMEEAVARLEPDDLTNLRRVRAAAQRMGRLMDDLLALSRAGTAPMRPRLVSLSEVARQVVDALRAAAPTREAEITVQADLEATADPALAHAIIANLVDNAWKFSAGRSPAHIEVGARDAAGERVFFVRDDGTGYDPRYADRLFRPFQRLHESGEYEGSGIGLAVVHRAVRRHGGRVWAEGAPGKGATFFFTLPEASD